MTLEIRRKPLKLEHYKIISEALHQYWDSLTPRQQIKIQNKYTLIKSELEEDMIQALEGKKCDTGNRLLDIFYGGANRERPNIHNQ